MRVVHPRRGGHPQRAGFTLVELLITITIIAILAGISLGALNAARQTARTAKTKATITKLDGIIMRRYEEYATRRVPISTRGLEPKEAAEMRLAALRDLMRMEMPERWSDVENDPITGIVRPALSKRYDLWRTRVGPTLDHQQAECLYMIISTGSAEDREKFNESEISDVDQDGCREFIDGWGKPIMFLRWAPGFTESDIQANIGSWSDWQNNRSPWKQNGNGEDKQIARDEDHDPFDPRSVDFQDLDNDHPTGWRLVPLIFSCGPDKEHGLCTIRNYTYAGNPYETFVYTDLAGNASSDLIGVGCPMKSGEHFDNIHNHHSQ